MKAEMRRRLGEAVRRARVRLRAGGCDWPTSGPEGDDGVAPFGTDAEALDWLDREKLSRMREEQEAKNERAQIALKFATLAQEELDALTTEAVGVDFSVQLHFRFVAYDLGTSVRQFRVTTHALRQVEEEARMLARRYRLTEGQATAAIMSGWMPEGRGRSAVDDRLDAVLRDVVLEMAERGHHVPGPGHPGRDSGVKAYWEEVVGLFNKAINHNPVLKKKSAGDWTTVRSRFKSLCERDPEFRKEIGGSDGREEQT